MRFISVSCSLVALIAFAGCAQQSDPSAMGAAPAASMTSAPATSSTTAYCRDGAWVAKAGECGAHGGVERVLGQ